MGVNEVLLMILLGLSCVLVAVLIVLGIKLLYSLGKLNIILNDIEGKLKNVNDVFLAVNGFTTMVSNVTESIFGKVVSVINKLVGKKEDTNE